ASGPPRPTRTAHRPTRTAPEGAALRRCVPPSRGPPGSPPRPAGDRRPPARDRAGACVAGAARGGAAPSSGLHDLEEPGPAQLGELGLVRVEQVAARIAVAELEQAALPLHLGDRVRVLGRRPARPGGI